MSSSESAIIIGIGPFISSSLAHYLARSKYRLGLITRKQSSLDRLAAELRSQTDVYVQTADAGDASSLSNALENLKAELGRIDVLIYNAARVGADHLMTLDPKVLEQDFKTAATGTLVAGQWFSKNANTTRDVRPLLLVTGGTLDRDPNADYASLSAAKAASQSISVMFAKVMPHDYGIQVGTPLIVQPIIPKEDGTGYQTKSDPDVIVKEVFQPYFDDRQRKVYGSSWIVERIF